MITSPLNSSSPCFLDPEDYHGFRQLLQNVGYTDGGILDSLGCKNLSSVRGSDVALFLRLTKKGRPLDSLTRLFLMDVPIEFDAFRKAVEPMSPETLLQAGLVEEKGGAVVAKVELLPYQDLYLAFDPVRKLQSELRHDYVMGVGSSSITLANLTVRSPSRLTLDLGTGCGIQALLAARHSDRILAVDRNPRAIRFAAFNAELNAMGNVECVQGDLFEPVQGQTFDLVISNPPFVISPEKRYIYRDGGMQEDQLCRKIVGDVSHYLRDGGFCHILCNWVERSGEDWRKRLADWFVGTGCDSWVIRSESRDIATYASTWIRHTEKDEPERYAERFEEWMAYYEQQGIHAVGAGLITMRRTTGRPNWFRADDAPEKMVGACGEYVLRGFALRDFLTGVQEDGMLLRTVLHFSPDVRLERLCAPSPEGWLDTVDRLHLTRGFTYAGDIDPYVANVIIGCDGKRELISLLSEMAQSLHMDVAEIQSTFCSVMRRLIECGFLLPPHL